MTSMSNPSEAVPATIWIEASSEQSMAVDGPDAKSWLNVMLSCDVKKVSTGRGVYGLALSKTGKIQTDCNVIATSSGVVFSVAADISLFNYFDQHLIMEDAELEQQTDVCWIQLHGPQALKIAAAVASAHSLPWGAIDWMGKGGVALLCPTAKLPELRDSLAAEGAGALSAAEWASLRLEYGFPKFGVDYSAKDNPHEASLDRRAVSWDKGCYIGQEVVCMQDMRGKVKRRLVSASLEGSELPAQDTEVVDTAANAAVGKVTSSSYSVTRECVLVMLSLRASVSRDAALEISGRRAQILWEPATAGDSS